MYNVFKINKLKICISLWYMKAITNVNFLRSNQSIKHNIVYPVKVVIASKSTMYLILNGKRCMNGGQGSVDIFGKLSKI